MDKIKETIKAGCYLVDVTNRKIGLIYRDNLDDYTFTKGHLEEGETLEECAVRETAEETKRIAEIVPEIEPVIERYVTPRGEHCVTYMYVAVDRGHSDNDSLEVHDLVWTDIDEVAKVLTYNNLRNSCAKVSKTIVEKLL